MRKTFAALALIALLPVAAQDQKVLSPLPSRFRAAINGSEIVLTWEASVDPAGGWQLYRSAGAFSEASFARAQALQKVAPALRKLSYSPPDSTPWFYALLPLDASGKPTIAFMPGKTVTAVAISVSVAAASNPIIPPPSKGIHNFIVAVGKGSLTLGFSISPGTGNVLVYRSLSPFSEPASLLSANLIATIPETTLSFIDYPVPGLSYYYALVKESDLKDGSVNFGTGSDSASIGPVGIAASAESLPLPETSALSRSYPLPSWLFAKPGDPGLGVRSAAIAPQTEKAIAAILGPFPKKNPTIPAFTLLKEDRTQARGGEEYALSLILRGPLKVSDWKSAIDQLQRYLSLNRSPAVASRAHFYLGQAYAMTGRYRDSFFEFLLARDFHAAETRPWLLWLVAAERS
ncbi:MAG: hypothetical protein M0001_08050 [Treponema sp.]|nr:hypothetical protein [Treponema sp.]